MNEEIKMLKIIIRTMAKDGYGLDLSSKNSPVYAELAELCALDERIIRHAFGESCEDSQPPSIDQDRLLGEKEVAEFLGIAANTLRNWRCVSSRARKSLASKGRKLAYVKVGRHVHYRYSDIIDFLERSRAASLAR